MELIPNPVHVYYDDRGLDLYGAALLTIQCVARWADYYRVWPVGYPPGSRDVEFEGPLPADPKACDALLASAFSHVRDWWLSQPEWRGYGLIGVSLDRADAALLDMHDGNMGNLFLTPEQVEELRQFWRHHGVPDDLYIRGPERCPQHHAPLGPGGCVICAENDGPARSKVSTQFPDCDF